MRRDVLRAALVFGAALLIVGLVAWGKSAWDGPKPPQDHAVPAIQLTPAPKMQSVTVGAERLP